MATENTLHQNVQQTDYILEVTDLKKNFPIETNFFGKPTRFLKAVDGVTFKIKRGTTIGVVGESGCGKTTLGRTILKLYESDGGKIVYNGEDKAPNASNGAQSLQNRNTSRNKPEASAGYRHRANTYGDCRTACQAA